MTRRDRLADVELSRNDGRSVQWQFGSRRSHLPSTFTMLTRRRQRDRQSVEHLPDEEPGLARRLRRPDLVAGEDVAEGPSAQRLRQDDARGLPALAAERERDARRSPGRATRRGAIAMHGIVAATFARRPRRRAGTVTSVSSGR